MEVLQSLATGGSRFPIVIITPQDSPGLCEECRWPSKAEPEIDVAEIFAVDELDPVTGSTAQSFDFGPPSASMDPPIDMSN